MSNLLIYILSTGICLSLFVLAYQIFLRDNMRFNLCRFYLISTILMSFLLPSIPIDLGISFVHKALQKTPLIDAEPIMMSSTPEIITSTPIESGSNINIDYIAIIGIVLLSISLLLFIRFIYRFGTIILIQTSGNRLENEEGFNLIFTDRTDNAFSFLGYIFINPLKFNDEEKRLIIEHEREHIRHFHSIDLILIELLIVMQWFNPFAYIARRKLIEIHEFIADNGVIRNGADPHSYQTLLLSVVTSSCLPTAGNQLSALITKKRIAMIGKPLNQTGRWINFLILVPIAAILIIGISAFSPKEPVISLNINSKNTIEEPSATSNLSELEKRAEKVMNNPNFLKDFYFNFPPKETNTNLSPLSSSSPESYNRFSVILKKDCEYSFFYFSSNKEDKLIARIEYDKSEVNVVETEFNFSYSGKRTFTPKKTGAYHLSMVNLTSKNTEVLMILSLNDNLGNGGDFASAQQDKLSSKDELLARAKKDGITNTLTNVYFELKPNEYQEKPTITLDGGNDYIFNFIAKTKEERIDAYINSVDKEKPQEAVVLFAGSTEIILHVKKTSEFSIRAGNRSSNNKVELLSLIRLKGKHDPKNDTLGKYLSKKPVEVVDTFMVVEQMPTFGNGKDDEFRNWVAANMKYPKEAADKGIQGRVFVQFIVSKDGSLGNPKVIKSANPILDAEAIRLISSSPKWNPGKQRGIAVNVSYVFPVTFGTSEEAKTIQIQANDNKKNDESIFKTLTNRADKEINYTYLKDFKMSLTPSGTQKYSIILKKECKYVFFLYTGSKDDKVNFSIGFDKNGEAVFETTGVHSDFSKIEFSPKQTATYHLMVENVTSKNSAILLYLTLKESSVSDLTNSVPYNNIATDEDEVFMVVEQMPTFGGGDPSEFGAWVATNMQYPKEALEKGIQGRVFVQFVIEKDGSITNAKVIRSVDPILDKEAVRVIELSPKWNPGMQRGNKVRVQFTFPITFTLK